MNKELKTPGGVDFLIENLSPPHLAEEIKGDLYELFLKDVEEKGLLPVKRRYVLNALAFS